MLFLVIDTYLLSVVCFFVTSLMKVNVSGLGCALDLSI